MQKAALATVHLVTKEMNVKISVTLILVKMEDVALVV